MASSRSGPLPRLDKSDIATRLRQTGAMLRFRGESIHRARAYERGADVLEESSEDLTRLVDEDRLTELPGIGRSLAARIGELVREGRSAVLDELAGPLPAGLLGLVGARGFTPRRLQRLHDELGVEDVDAVREALASGAVIALRGIGPVAAAQMRQSLEAPPAPRPRVVLVEAARVADQLVAHLRRATGAMVEVVGSIRRASETVGDVNLLAASQSPPDVIAAFARHHAVVGVTERAESRCVVMLPQHLVATLTVESPSRFGAALMRATGSAAHVDELERRARERGVALDALVGPNEADVYGRLGLPWIPPELREGKGEIAAAAAGDTFADLVTFEDLRGAVHCHSVYSDGKDTLADMAGAAARLGLSYLTVTDHSPAAFYANGLSSERIRAQWQEMAELQPALPVELLRGTECDILRDGTLDHAADVRADLAVVIASVHQRYKLDAAATTERLIQALQTPQFKIWGHPLGRLLLKRPPVACDVDRVLDVAAKSPTAIELNGSPWRLDLPSELIPAARKRGLPFVISCDAHSMRELEYLRCGVALARRGGVRRSEVLNVLPVGEFRRALGH